jgi:MFS family permease
MNQFMAGEVSASLWHNRAFLRLWIADVLSKSGSQITAVALPLTAVLVLEATPGQMGLLGVAGSLPNLLFGLFTGVWVDRMRRSPILVGADLGRALLLGSIPVAALLGYLTFTHLVLVVFATATLSIFFILAAVSILPSLVEEEKLVEANGKLAISGSVLGVAGPGVAGGLIQIMSAPIAIAVDALSYLLSALSLSGISASETPLREKETRGNIWREIGEGIRELIRTRILQILTLAACAGTLGGGIIGTVLVLFLTHDLGLTPATIGIVFAFSGVGSVVGASLAGPTGHRIGIGPAVILSSLIWTLGYLVIPLAGLTRQNFLFVAAGQVLIGIGAAIWSVNQMSLRQSLTPVGLFGRATAARRFLIFGLATVGAALGGLLGEVIGLRATLVVGALIVGMGVPPVLFSPVRHVHRLADVSKI